MSVIINTNKLTLFPSTLDSSRRRIVLIHLCPVGLCIIFATWNLHRRTQDFTQQPVSDIDSTLNPAHPPESLLEEETIHPSKSINRFAQAAAALAPFILSPETRIWTSHLPHECLSRPSSPPPSRQTTTRRLHACVETPPRTLRLIARSFFSYRAITIVVADRL